MISPGCIPKTAATSGAEWHYVRPNDPAAQKAWHFVYPGKYVGSSTGAAGQNTTNGNQPRLAGTDVVSPARQSNIDLSSFGQPDAGGA